MTDERLATAAWESLYRAQVTVFRQLRADFPAGEVSLTEYDVLFNLAFVGAAALAAAVVPDDGRSYGVVAAGAVGYAVTAAWYTAVTRVVHPFHA